MHLKKKKFKKQMVWTHTYVEQGPKLQLNVTFSNAFEPKPDINI